MVNCSGYLPDGTECQEESCLECVYAPPKQEYIKWKCEECGHELEIWLDRIEEERPAEDNGFKYERRHLMWHCTECGCDYESYWETQWGDTMESKPQRKFWG